MTILEALKEKKITISCGNKTLTCNSNGTFYIVDYSEISENNFVTTSQEDIAVDALLKKKVCKIIN